MGGFSFMFSNRIKLRKHTLALNPVIRPKLHSGMLTPVIRAKPCLGQLPVSSGQRWVLTPEQLLELCQPC